MAKTNPNGANQYLLDPRQKLFFECWLNPKSETFSNVLESAIRAGFEQSYAKVIYSQMPEWFSEKLKELNLLSKAERNLNKFLDMDGKPQIQADITKFVAERLGRKKYGKDEPPQGDTFNTIIFNDQQSAEIARRRLASDRPSEETPN